MNLLIENTYKALEFYERGLLSESELIELIESGLVDIEMLDEGFVDSLKNGAKKLGHVVKRTAQVGAVAGLIGGGAWVHNQNSIGEKYSKDYNQAKTSLYNYVSDHNKTNKTAFVNSKDLKNSLIKKNNENEKNINLYQSHPDYQNASKNINDNKETIDNYNKSVQAHLDHKENLNKNIQAEKDSIKHIQKDTNAAVTTGKNLVNNLFGSEVFKLNPNEKVVNEKMKKIENMKKEGEKKEEELKRDVDSKSEAMKSKDLFKSLETKKEFDNEISKYKNDHDKNNKKINQINNLEKDVKEKGDKYFNSREGQIHATIKSLKDYGSHLYHSIKSKF